jgi:hypothetical protein
VAVSFASIDRAKLREFLTRRVTDGVVRRLIDKWLKAGVMEDGQLFYPDAVAADRKLTHLVR